MEGAGFECWIARGVDGAVAGLRGSTKPKGAGRSKNSRMKQRPTVRLADVAGVEEAKAEVQEVVDFLRAHEV